MNDKEYTYHMFYIKPKCMNDEDWVEFINDNMDPDDIEIGLYAYTDNNELAKMFINTRNMKCFIHIKRKIPKSMVKDFAEYHPRGYLEKVEFSTFVDSKNVFITLAVTQREKTYCFSEIEWRRSSILYKLDIPNIAIFNPSIQKHLYTLGYQDVIRFQNGLDVKKSFIEDRLNAFMNRFYLTMEGS